MIIPGILLSIFGAAISAGGMFTAREYNSALFGNMFLCWFTRNSAESDSLKSIIIALFSYNLIAFIMTVITVIAGILNGLGWLIVLVYLFFTVGFGYFLFQPNKIKNT